MLSEDISKVDWRCRRWQTYHQTGQPVVIHPSIRKPPLTSKHVQNQTWSYFERKWKCKETKTATPLNHTDIEARAIPIQLYCTILAFAGLQRCVQTLILRFVLFFIFGLIKCISQGIGQDRSFG